MAKEQDRSVLDYMPNLTGTLMGIGVASADVFVRLTIDEASLQLNRPGGSTTCRSTTYCSKVGGRGQHLLLTVLRYVSFLDYTAEFLERTIITCHLHEGYSQKIAHTGNENFRKTHTHTHKGKQTGNMY